MTTNGPPSDSIFGTDAPRRKDAAPSRGLARRTDPATSHEAAEKVDLAKGEWLALEAVRDCPGWTARELDARFAPKSDRAIGKRLCLLERSGKVYRGVRRRCRVTGNNATTWWPEEVRRATT